MPVTANSTTPGQPPLACPFSGSVEALQAERERERERERKRERKRDWRETRTKRRRRVIHCHGNCALVWMSLSLSLRASTWTAPGHPYKGRTNMKASSSSSSSPAASIVQVPAYYCLTRFVASMPLSGITTCNQVSWWDWAPNCSPVSRPRPWLVHTATGLDRTMPYRTYTHTDMEPSISRIGARLAHIHLPGLLQRPASHAYKVPLHTQCTCMADMCSCLVVPIANHSFGSLLMDLTRARPGNY
ncbi:hypothetical protein J3F83DRAFT_45913 [Trichoderma novae-zelandiae]